MRFRNMALWLMGIAIVFEVAIAVALATIVYQVTPQSILAHQTFIGKIPGFLSGIRVLDRAMNIFYWGSPSPVPLPEYALTVDLQALQTIEDHLPKNLPSSWYGNLFLTDDAKTWVDGAFFADGEKFAVKLRVRGDIFNHWAYRKKSWRIRLKGDQLFHGMKEFNLIIPEDRGWIAEPLNAYRARKFGLIQPSMRFVTLSLNGSAPMVYLEVEQWEKEMLEMRAKSGDSPLYGAGGGTSIFQQWDAVFESPAYWQVYLSKASSPLHSREEILALLALSRPGASQGSQYQAEVSRLFDVDKIIHWYALSLLAGSRHVRDHNLRFFFDMSRGRFEPIPWDIELFAPRPLLALPGNPFLNEFFRVPEWKLKTYQFLWAYIHTNADVDADMAEAQRLRLIVERAAYRDSVKLPSNRTVKREIDRVMDLVRTNIAFLKKELARSEILMHQRVPSHRMRNNGLLLTFDFIARGTSAARLHEISVPPGLVESIVRGDVRLLRDDGDGILNAADRSVPLTLRDHLDKKGRPVFQTASGALALLWPGDPIMGEGETVLAAPHTLHKFFLVRVHGKANISNDDLPFNLDVRNAVTGEKADILGEALIDERTFERLPEAYASREAFLQRNPAFRPEGEHGVMLAGTPVFSETVIVPSTVRLRIAPGTRVRMGSGVTLLSYAPVDVVGTENAPVIFEPVTQNPWGVFLVANAEGQSRVAWAEFSGGSEAFINGIAATGMVAFHGSPVVIRDSTFRSSHGDDALNIKYVPVDIARAHFINPDSDAIDLDMAPSGLIEDSTFFVDDGDTSSNGDGLDLSWTSVTIRRVTIEGSRDKCISVGEHSEPVIEDVTLERCHYGIVSKDSSHATVRRARFIGNDIAVGAYVKKSIFSGSSIAVQDSVFEGNGKQQEALDGSTITIQ